MEIRREEREIEVKAHKTDDRGYIFCGNCLGFGRGGEVVLEPPDVASTWCDDETCDGCHKHFDNWPTITTIVEVDIEYFTCKIF